MAAPDPAWTGLRVKGADAEWLRVVDNDQVV
jgi:hypothetical protein